MAIVKMKYIKKNGKKNYYYQAQIYINGVRLKCKTFKQKAEAYIWQDKEKERLLRDPSEKKSTNLFFSDCFDRYLEEAFPLLQVSTQQSFENRFKYFTKGPLFHCRMENFTSQSVHIWIDWMKGQPTAKTKRRKSFARELRILSVILNWYRNFVDENFIVPITKKHRQLCYYKPVTPRRPDYFIRPDDVKRWVEWLKENKENPAYWKLAVFMLLTGTRVSEACGMCWDAVDLESGTASVIRRMRWDQRTKQPYLEQAAKTKTSVRLLHLPDELIEMLRELKKETGREELLFRSMNNKPLSYTRIPLCFNQGFKALGLPWRSTHILRHTYATIALYATRDISAVQASLGHASQKMTEKYAKVVALLSRNTAEKTAKVFNLFDRETENHSESHSKTRNESKSSINIRYL